MPRSRRKKLARIEKALAADAARLAAMPPVPVPTPKSPPETIASKAWAAFLLLLLSGYLVAKFWKSLTFVRSALDGCRDAYHVPRTYSYKLHRSFPGYDVPELCWWREPMRFVNELSLQLALVSVFLAGSALAMVVLSDAAPSLGPHLHRLPWSSRLRVKRWSDNFWRAAGMAGIALGVFATGCLLVWVASGFVRLLVWTFL